MIIIIIGKKNIGQKYKSDDDDEIIRNIGSNNSTDDLSEPDDEMETGSINDNIRNAFYFAARINLHAFLAKQVASVLLMSYLLFGVSVSIRNLSYKPQIIIAKNSPFDVFES